MKERGISMAGRKQNVPALFRFYKYFIILLAIILILNYLYHNSSLYYRKTLTLPFTLHLSRTDIYLIKGEESHLSVFGINKRVSYSSTNFRVVGVNFTGRIYGYQTGKAFIIAKVGKKELRCRVHVIDINKEKIELSVGKTYRLKIRGSNAFVSWKSQNKEVATVSIFGKVTAKQKGSTTIYAKIKGKTLKCLVIVK